MPQNNFIYVDNDQQLALLCQQWNTAKFLALDTEFIRTDTFYPITGLLQLSEGEKNYLIDPLVIKDWACFIGVLTNQSITKVLHSCSEDLEVFDRLLGVLPAPLFDTQIAAAMLGFGFSLSYQNLVAAMLDVHVEKGETRSNWLQRPLTASQCHYAALDVEYLPEIYLQLNTALLQTGRSHWLMDECSALCEGFYQVDDYYKKIKSAWKLSGKQLHVLDKVTQWREQQAQQRNVPRGRVIKDKSCYELASMMPSQLNQLSRITDLGPKTIRVDGEKIIELIVTAKDSEAKDFPKVLAKPLPLQMGGVLKELKLVVATRAAELNVATEVLVKKRDYESLLRSGLNTGNYQLPVSLQGWRKSVVGEALLHQLSAMSKS